MHAELQKLTEKFSSFEDVMENSYNSVDGELASLKCLLESAPIDGSPESKLSIKKCVEAVRSKLTEYIKCHRDIHSSVSKFGKLIDKKSIEDFTALATYFSDRSAAQPRKLTESDPSVTDTSMPFISEEGTRQRSSDELLHLVIVEHLFRQGHDRLATELVENFGFSVDEVKSSRFQELSKLLSTIHSGDLNYAREWLSKHNDQLGSKVNQLEYTLAKLEFLYTMQRNPQNHSAVLERARQLTQYAHIYPADFEHLMGSLVFFGRSLKDTPYADLSVFAVDEDNRDEGAPEPMQMSPSSSQPDLTATVGLISTGEDSCASRHKQSNALSQASSLFKTNCCAQLNLSELDPLYTVFTSGCRMLSRRQMLQNAISCATRFSSMHEDTLPVAIELDPVAHRHNIFHCPVLKEVTSSTNGPVRLNCGHAISKMAFESMLTGDRSKVKCPYCPLDTYKNQTLELIF